MRSGGKLTVRRERGLITVQDRELASYYTPAGSLRLIVAYNASRRTGSGPPVVRTEDEAIARARSVLHGTRLRLDDEVQVKPSAPWADETVEVSVISEPVAFGYETLGFAGSMDVVLNRYLGKVATIFLRPERTCDPPNIRVTESQALDIATSVWDRSRYGTEGVRGDRVGRKANLQYYVALGDGGLPRASVCDAESGLDVLGRRVLASAAGRREVSSFKEALERGHRRGNRGSPCGSLGRHGNRTGSSGRLRPCHNRPGMDERSVREAMCEIGRRLWERGLIGAAEGNLSARLLDSSILCTPAGVDKGRLQPEDLLVIDFDGNPLPPRGSELRPSSEIRLHLAVFKARPDCCAVVHAHPPTATGFALAGLCIPAGCLPEADVVLGPVALVPFAMPGTDEVPRAMAPFLQEHKTFLLANHGAVTLGAELGDAFERMETLERIARIILAATQLGGVRPLPESAATALSERFLNGKLC
jgi:L-fuculose-phosphate aldolase